MNVDMFLKIDGIEGESKDDAHQNEIDVLSWNWAMTQSGTFGVGGGGGSGKVNIDELEVRKYMDIASPMIMLYCANGKHIPEAVLVVRKAGENPLEYVTVTMRKIIVTSVINGVGIDEKDRVIETVRFNFAEVEVKYVKQSDTGSEEGNKVFGWNIEKNIQL